MPRSVKTFLQAIEQKELEKFQLFFVYSWFSVASSTLFSAGVEACSS